MSDIRPHKKTLKRFEEFKLRLDRSFNFRPPQSVPRKTARCLNSVEYCRSVCPGFDIRSPREALSPFQACLKFGGPIDRHALPLLQHRPNQGPEHCIQKAPNRGKSSCRRDRLSASVRPYTVSTPRCRSAETI